MNVNKKDRETKIVDGYFIKPYKKISLPKDRDIFNDMVVFTDCDGFPLFTIFGKENAEIVKNHFGFKKCKKKKEKREYYTVG